MTELDKKLANAARECNTVKKHNLYKHCLLLCALLLANAHADALPAEWTSALSVPAG